MKKASILILLLSLVFHTIDGQTIYATQNGSWHDVETWNIGNGAIPSVTDEVEIDGFTVTINHDIEDVMIKNLTLKNSNGVGATQLIVEGDSRLVVAQNLNVSSWDIAYPVGVELRGNSKVEVLGKVEFYRYAVNTKDGKLQLYMKEESEMLVKGEFIYEYQSSGVGENNKELWLENNASLTVEGGMNCNYSSGKDFQLLASDLSSIFVGNSFIVNKSGAGSMTFQIDHLLDVNFDLGLAHSAGSDTLSFLMNGVNAKIEVGGNLALTSTANSKIELIGGEEGSEFDVRGNLNISGSSNNDINIHLKENSNFILGGNVIRPSNYGNLRMETGSSFTLNGTSSQEIPKEKEFGSGSDLFSIKKIVLDNPAGFTLMDTFFIKENMELSEGILVSESYKPIVIADGAEIINGSESAYINGPVIKQGRSTDSFVFPIGNDDRYAPITVGRITNKESSLVAEYKGDPPPFGVYEKGVVSELEYWELKAEVEKVNLPITLEWKDATASGITDLDSLIVVGFNADDDEWSSFGRASVTGGTGAGVAGSIQSLEGDPPPFGVYKFTFGSTDPINPLPVELTHFNAIKQETKVQLAWETASEINTSHFTVERSYDGRNYEPIGTINAVGESHKLQRYTFRDVSPTYGDNYYRLKIEDKDNSYEYSSAEVVTYELIPFLAIAPNPVTNQLRIKGPEGSSEKGTMEIFNQRGMLIFKGPFVFENGFYEINTSALNINESGTYFLKITGATEAKSIKFMKIK